jgi:hypothetical protein
LVLNAVTQEFLKQTVKVVEIGFLHPLISEMLGAAFAHFDQYEGLITSQLTFSMDHTV